MCACLVSQEERATNALKASTERTASHALRTKKVKCVGEGVFAAKV